MFKVVDEAIELYNSFTVDDRRYNNRFVFCVVKKDGQECPVPIIYNTEHFGNITAINGAKVLEAIRADISNMLPLFAIMNESNFNPAHKAIIIARVHSGLAIVLLWDGKIFYDLEGLPDLNLTGQIITPTEIITDVMVKNRGMEDVIKELQQEDIFQHLLAATAKVKA